MSNMFLPCEWIKSVTDQIENKNLMRVNNFDCNFTNKESQISVRNRNNINNINLIWKDIQFFDNCISQLRTWESLGAPESSKEPLFVTDLPETAVHLARIRQTSILSLLPKKVKDRNARVNTYRVKIALCFYVTGDAVCILNARSFFRKVSIGR